MITVQQRCRQLHAQLPGWRVWRRSGLGWYAVPAPPTVPLDQVVAMPGKVGPFNTADQLLISVRGPKARRPWRRCFSCSGVCHWCDTSWVCDECGDEWDDLHHPKYAAPGDDARRP